METITVKLKKGQYLSDVEPFKAEGIRTNSILHKVIPGCGATRLEIEYTKRNSIIIVPNMPVIEDKVKEHNKDKPKEKHILGVYKGIDMNDIDDYLNSEATYKKILTTPEGFLFKIIPAFENDRDRMIKDFFLLFDECERIVTDVSYRGNIAAPIDWFFKFENKALVSATTLPFTHEGFKDFDHYVVDPQFDFSKPITVINTNNVIESLEEYSKKLSSKHLFIFINSTEAIYDIADVLSIKLQSHAYCAEKSVANLAAKKYSHGYSKLNLKELAKYNFLTSRYFSALDIKLDYRPDVILISDVFTAKHSVLDPQTEVIQIAGRFRNGINSLTHITNFNPAIESKSEIEALQYLKGCFDTFDYVVDLFSKSKDEGSRDTLKFFVEKSPIADYYSDNKVNPFMVDNYIYEQRVKGYYQTFENLKETYSALDKHFKPTFLTYEYVLSDEDRLNRKGRLTKREQQWEALRQIDRLSSKPKPGVFRLTFPNSDSLLKNLRSLYPWLTEAYDLLGLEGLKQTGLTAAKVNPAKTKAQELKELKKLAPLVYPQFKENSEPFDEDIFNTLEEACAKAEVTIKPTKALILKLFDGRRSTKKGRHTHILKSKIDLDALTPFD